MMRFETFLLSALLLGSSSVLIVKADFGDYVDPTFDCPATTTCPQVCVANATVCPTELLCGQGETLCADGSCASNCTGNEVSPCEFKCAPVACHQVVDTLDECSQKYGAYIASEATCGETEVEENTSLWKFNEPGFVFFYTWFLTATFLLLSWCTFNQRLAPVEGSTKSLALNMTTTGEKNLAQGYQTGYQIHPVGSLVYFVTVSTLWIFQALLAWLVVQFYVQQEFITGMNVVFEDERQVLIAFEVTWGKSLTLFHMHSQC